MAYPAWTHVHARICSTPIIEALTRLATDPAALGRVRALLNHPTRVYCDGARSPDALHIHAYVGQHYVHIRIEFQETTDGLDMRMTQLSQKRRYCIQVFFWVMHALDSIVKIPKLLTGAIQHWIQPSEPGVPDYAGHPARLLSDRSATQIEADLTCLLSLSQPALEDIGRVYPVIRQRVERRLINALNPLCTMPPSDPYAWESAMGFAQLARRLGVRCPSSWTKRLHQLVDLNDDTLVYRHLLISRLTS